MSDISGKVWGKTQNIFTGTNFEVHRIVANKGGYSSNHLHKHKYNMFYVESGKLEITVFKNDYDLIDKTVISTDESTTVKPGEYHMFKVLEDTIAYEIYWVEFNPDDIVRDNVGGK